MGYSRSPFRDFESYIRIFVGLDEENIQMILKQFSSYFINYEILPGSYTFENFSDAVYTMGDHEGTIQIEYANISMETKLIVTNFVGLFGTLGFSRTSSSNTLS